MSDPRLEMTTNERDTYWGLGVFLWLFFACGLAIFWMGGFTWFWPAMVMLAASGLCASGRFVMRKGVHGQ